MSPQLLAMLRNGQHPLDAYGVPALVPRISAALSRILQTCHSTYGAATLTRHIPLFPRLLGAVCCLHAADAARAALSATPQGGHLPLSPLLACQAH